MIAENTISVRDLYLIAQSFRWDFKPRSILATHAFDLVGIKRSWHFTEGGSVIMLGECLLQTDTQHAKRKWRGIKVGKKKCNLIDD